MAITPLNGQNSNSRTYWLDKALEGQSPEIKARVLELVLKMGIEPEDEFFVIFVGMGQLQVLLLEAPEQWQEIFARFLLQLEGWTKTLEKKLAVLPSGTSMSEDGLKKSIAELTQMCNGLKNQLQGTNQGVTQSIGTLETKIDRLTSSLVTALGDLKGQKQQLGTLKFLTDRVNGLVDELVVNQKEQVENEESSIIPPTSVKEWVEVIKEFLWTYKGELFSYVVVFLVGFGIARSMYFPKQQLLESTAQRTQWLLEKENRRDCLQGIKPKGSPECKEVFKKVKGLGKGK